MDNDWRLQGQEDYLYGVTLCWEVFTPLLSKSDHEHCAFCNRRFSQGTEDLHEGFTTLDGEYWICSDCFYDFEAEFKLHTFKSELFVGKSFVEVVRQEISCGIQNRGLYSAKRILNLCAKLDGAHGIKIVSFELTPVLVAMTLHPHPPLPLTELTQVFSYEERPALSWTKCCSELKQRIERLLLEPGVIMELSNMKNKLQTRDIAVFLQIMQKDTREDNGTVHSS